MRRPFYKSLDRDVELLNIRGSWIYIAGGGVGVSLVLGVILGAIFGTAVGMMTAIVGAAVSFFGCITFQTKLPSRQLGKAYISGRTKGWVIRRESLSRILLKDKIYEEFVRIRSSREGRD